MTSPHTDPTKSDQCLAQSPETRTVRADSGSRPASLDHGRASVARAV